MRGPVDVLAAAVLLATAACFLLQAIASLRWFAAEGYGVRDRFRHLRTGQRVSQLVLWLCALGELGALGSAVVDDERTSLAGGCGAIAVLAVSAALWTWAWRTMRKRPLAPLFAHSVPAMIHDDGPWRLVRHPIYLSYALLFAAPAIAVPVPWLRATLAAVALGCAALYVVAARVEERELLASPLGASYERYRARTPAFLPSPTSLRATLLRAAEAA